MIAKFSLKDFYAQIIEKFVVAIPDMIESQRIAKKVSGNQKSLKCNAEDFPCKKFVVLLFVKIIFYFLMDFFIPKKSTIGKISMAAMQKIPISKDFTKAQEAIPHRSKGTPHAQYGTFQRKSNPKRISKPMINAG